MAVTYKKLFHMLIDRDMTPAQLQQEAGYSTIHTASPGYLYFTGVRGEDMPCAELQGG